MPSALVAVVVVSFSFYGADDSAAKHQLEALMTLDEVPEEDVEGTRSPEAPHGGDARPSFDARCAEVCERYGLSPREREVFALLARGRNAKIIQEELCVSASTAKTHIYNIYRKMGIHSLQELLDLLDAEEAARRAEIAVDVQSDIIDEYNASILGEEREVLCEGFDGQAQLFYGRSCAESPEIDGRIWFSAGEEPEPGDFVTVRLTGGMDGELTGELVE